MEIKLVYSPKQLRSWRKRINYLQHLTAYYQAKCNSWNAEIVKLKKNIIDMEFNCKGHVQTGKKYLKRGKVQEWLHK